MYSSSTPAAPAAARGRASVGPMGRLGAWMASHFAIVVGAWVVLAIGLGVFAPRVEHALSGAGWEASGSESVQARALLDEDFDGLSASALQVVVASDEQVVGDRAFEATVRNVEATLETDERVSRVVSPADSGAISEDGHVVVVQAAAGADSNDMVRAADDLKGPLAELGGTGTTVSLTGASGMWSDFNEANKKAMLRSEVISWPVTLTILVVAFGSLIAAGLPLMLTILGLVAAAGSLYLGAQLFDISIWAMNFALMFALALGIDYALFIVYRFRGAFFGEGRNPVDAVAVTMDTAGKAVMFSGVTVLISLTAVMLVPSPAFRSMALGIMLAVTFVLAASLTLLPAVLARLGPRLDGLALPWVHSGEHRSARFGRWGERLWRRPLLYGLPALALLLLLAAPILKLETGMPSIAVVPADEGSRVGYERIQASFGEGAPGALQIVGPAGRAEAAGAVLGADEGIAGSMPAVEAGGLALLTAMPVSDPSEAATGTTIERLRDELPAGMLLGGAAAENHDLEQLLGERTPLVIGVVLALGFLLLLVALQAPLIAALGVVTNLLAVGAAFGVATWIFQDGNLSGLLGFESQGFLDAWAPVFFFAMVFAISMDYTVFLLSSAKEHWDRTGDAREAMIGGMAHSGRVIGAAAAVMVAVFFTFALSGPLPPKEMGVILGIAVMLDALLVRLLLVPVLLRVAGPRAWALPRWLDRILPDVRFGHD
jgi:putative drug exporter of the RND superfamily